MKAERYETVDVEVGGYVGELGQPRSLLLGAYDNTGALRYMGGTLPHPQGWSTDPVLQTVLELPATPSFAPESMPGHSRWESHRFDKWFQLPPVVACEVAFSRLDGGFLRHGARFVRWRPDKDRSDCALMPLHACAD